MSARQWYRDLKKQQEPQRRGPKPKDILYNIDPEAVIAVVSIATVNPWYGYKRIAVIVRREGWNLSNRQVLKVMKSQGLLQKRQKNPAEIYQAKKLYELLPNGPNQLWQMDVTYIHIAGHGWWYAVTVIDYYSRYLLACHFTPSYRATDCVIALGKAVDEAKSLTGPFTKPIFLVTDNGSSFLARQFADFLSSSDFQHVRIQYRTPQQLGLLERFHQTLKREEVYWNFYTSPGEARASLEVFRKRYNTYRPHWALIPEESGDPVTPYDVFALGRKTQIPRWQKWAQKAKEKIDADLVQFDQRLVKTGS